MDQLNALRGYKTTDTPRECNSQPPEDNFKYRTYPSKTSTVVSDIMGRLNHHAIDNGDVEVHPSEFPVEYNCEYVPYSDTTLIKSIDDYEMDHFL